MASTSEAMKYLDEVLPQLLSRAYHEYFLRSTQLLMKCMKTTTLVLPVYLKLVASAWQLFRCWKVTDTLSKLLVCHNRCVVPWLSQFTMILHVRSNTLSVFRWLPAAFIAYQKIYAAARDSLALRKNASCRTNESLKLRFTQFVSVIEGEIQSHYTLHVNSNSLWTLVSSTFSEVESSSVYMLVRKTWLPSRLPPLGSLLTV
jgi:hypothetical protein